MRYTLYYLSGGPRAGTASATATPAALAAWDVGHAGTGRGWRGERDEVKPTRHILYVGLRTQQLSNKPQARHGSQAHKRVTYNDT